MQTHVSDNDERSPRERISGVHVQMVPSVP